MSCADRLALEIGTRARGAARAGLPADVAHAVQQYFTGQGLGYP